MGESPQVALVTGGNRGIGLEAVRILLVEKLPHKVFLGCRDLKAGQAQAKLLCESFGDRVEALELDVADSESLRKAAELVAEKSGGHLDILVNNAGILLEGDGKHFAMEAARQTFAVNFEGVVAATEAFLPLLKASPAPAVVLSTSSSQGNRTLGLLGEEHRKALMDPQLDMSRLRELLVDLVEGLSNPNNGYHSIPTVAYGLSKMGVNCFTQIMARAHPEMAFNACSPGFCNTDMCANYTGQRKPKEPALGASVFQKVLFGELRGSTGAFFKENSKAGTPIEKASAAQDAWVNFPEQ